MSTGRQGPRRAREKTALLPERSQVSFQRCRLTCVEGPAPGHDWELDRDVATVGSADDADVIVPHVTVSRRHFQIVRAEGHWTLRDLDSTNGTYVDDLRVKDVYLRPGARITAGAATFRFELATRPADIAPSDNDSFGRVLGKSVAMRQIFSALERVAPTDATVLLIGDTGTGKGAVARSIHDSSRRSGGPFVVFDCGAVAPNLIESELFGHERGAFTGAVKQRTGALEEAQGGTLFIDELAELPLNLQPKLLRALEERVITRVGSTKPISIDCRIVAATQHDLWEEVTANRFRRDLYFRLAVVTVELPALQHRREDLPLLVNRFLDELGARPFTTFDDIPAPIRDRMLAYAWHGNVRELRNVIERLCVTGGSGAPGWADSFTIAPGVSGKARAQGAAPGALTVSVDPDLPFKDAKEQLVDAFEKQYVARLMAKTGDNVAWAAREAQIGRRHLYTLLAKHGLADDGGE